MAIQCSNCGKKLQVAADLAGKKVKCPCGTVLQVPMSTGSVPAKGGVAPTSNRPPSATPRPVGNATNLVATKPGATRAAATKPVGATAAGAKTASIGAGRSTASPVQPSGDFGFDRSEVSAMFDGLSDADLQAPKSPKVKSSKGKKDPLAGFHSASPSSQQSEERKGAAKNVYQSIWILVGLGLLRVVLGTFLFMNAEEEVNDVVLSDPSFEGDAATLLTMVKIIYGINIGIGAAFLICAGLVFMFPMSCTIVAMVLYIIGEIIGFVLNPLQLVNIRGWIIRAGIFGGLVQAINNASYYKFVKSGGRDGG